MRNRLMAIALSSLFVFGAVSGARAEWLPGHPRVNEVNERLANQRFRIAEGVEHGRISPWRAWREREIDRRIGWRLHQDDARHGGHITLAEQHQLNRDLNWNSGRIH